MSRITIQCRLVASEQSLRCLWELMAQKNTPLINELLTQLEKNPGFEMWVQTGKLPAGLIKTLCNSLKNDSRFAGQPSRFYYSAISLVDYIYKSWFAIQKLLQRRIEGKERWLSMLKSNVELEQDSHCTLDVIRTKADVILTTVATPLNSQKNKRTQSKKKSKTSGKPDKTSSTLFNSLFKAYEETEDCLTRCALVYLLKNNCQLSEVEEDPALFTLNRRKKEIEIERLKQQQKSRIPKGRDLTGEKWLETLAIATSTVPQNENEAKLWQANLLRKSSVVPFPIAYETNEDMTWFKNEFGRIFVKFNGLSEHSFEIYCDSRHLHWFNRFLEDQQTKRESKDQHSSSLFTLRSGRLVWHECQGKGEKWNLHRLTLHCSLDTRLWTTEGTQQVAIEKAAEIAKILTKTKEKGELNQQQQAFITRKQSTLNRINKPFPRPSKPLYQGQPSILVGVSFGLNKPATVAVVDVINSKVIAYRSIKQLLGENYQLLNRQRQQQRRYSHERHKAQKLNAPNSYRESKLGQYVDKLIAGEIVDVAKTHQASSIVLPKLGDMRQIVQSEIQAKAEKKIPGYKEGQQQYAKQYRVSAHRWSYGRLIEKIQSFAAQAGIAVEIAKQPIRGSPQEQARDLAITAYQTRTTTPI